MFVAFSLASVFGFVFATSAIVAQFGDIALSALVPGMCPSAGRDDGRARAECISHT